MSKSREKYPLVEIVGKKVSLDAPYKYRGLTLKTYSSDDLQDRKKIYLGSILYKM